MKLEDRYIVLKQTDVNKLSRNHADLLKDALYVVARVREDAGKPPLQAVVIEHDWPEYEPTLALLSARVDGTPAPAPVKVGQLTLEVGMQTDKVQRLVEFIRNAVSSGVMSESCAEQLGEHLNDLSLTEMSPDANVELNRKMLLDRSKVGLEKYGVTTERDDLTPAQWAQHAIEEALDLANYLQALKGKLQQTEAVIGASSAQRMREVSS